MKWKGLASILGLGALAFVAVIGIFHLRESAGKDPEIAGKLSTKVAGIEKRYMEFQEEWKKHEKEFIDKKAPEKLNLINVGFNELWTEAKELPEQEKSDSAIAQTEKDALPHLIASLEASALIPNVFMMWQINPALVTDVHWQQTKKWTKQANEEWKEWHRLTKSLSR